MLKWFSRQKKLLSFRDNGSESTLEFYSDESFFIAVIFFMAFDDILFKCIISADKNLEY